MKTVQEQLSAIDFVVRVGFGPSWELAQQVQDLAELHKAKLIGGSAEQGQHFYKISAPKWVAFKDSLFSHGFIATLS